MIQKMKTAYPADRWFETDHLKHDLSGRSVRGGAITLVAQLCKLALTMLVISVLGRLLTPADFGLVAMVTAITGFAAMFKDAGLAMATIQRKHITREQVSTLFWLNVTLGLMLTLLIIAAAPGISYLYGEPRLTMVAIAVAGTFLLSGLSIQHQALLKRQMEFKTLALLEFISIAVGTVAAIISAALGAGYWALVVQSLTMNLMIMISSWAVVRWIPGRPVRGSGVRAMLKLGYNVSFTRFINYWAGNSDNIMIGMYWNAAALGLYSSAYKLLTLPLIQIMGPMANVMVPVLSRRQDDILQYRQTYIASTRALCYLTGLITALCFGLADQIVYLVLGDQWGDAVPIFRCLALGMIAGPLSNSCGWLFISSDKSGYHVRWELFATPIRVAAFAAGLPWGPIGVAWGYSISTLLLRPPLFYYASKHTPCNLKDFASVLHHTLPLTLIIGAASYLTQAMLATNPFLVILSGTAVAGISAGLYIVLMPGAFEDIKQTMSAIKHLRSNQKR